MTRAWFRRRLDTDARRWILLLAALEGIGAYALSSSNKPRLLESGAGVALWLGFAALAPALGILAMLGHGRLLWWTGKLLGGRATPPELHAAFAWSQAPFVVAVAPLVFAIPLRSAALLMDPVPEFVRLGAGLMGTATAVFEVIAVAASLTGQVLYVRFLGEAQRIRAGRAIANHVLAACAGLAIFIGAYAVSAWVVPGSMPLVRLPIGIATAIVLAIAAETAVRIAARRARCTVSPNP